MFVRGSLSILPRVRCTRARCSPSHAIATSSVLAAAAVDVEPARSYIEHMLPFDIELSGSDKNKAKKLLNMCSAYMSHALCDVNTNGYVTCGELKTGLRAVGVNLSDSQMEKVLDRYDDNPRNGVFEREELVPLFNDLKLHMAVGSTAAVARGLEAHLFFVSIQSVATGQMEEPTVGTQLLENIMKADSRYLTYSLFDKNSHGFITPDELQHGLKAIGGLEVSDEDLHRIIERYDDNKNGVFEPSELTPFFCDLQKHGSIGAVLSADLYERVYNAGASYLTYSAFDINSTGYITPEELRDGLKSFGGITLTDWELDEIVARFDDNRNNVLEPEEVCTFLDAFAAAGSIHALLAKPANTETSVSTFKASPKLISHDSSYLTHALLDLNTNGFVTPCETQSALNALGVHLNDDQLAAIVDRYDDNNNGVFEREELIPLFDDLKIHTLLCGYP